MYSVCQYMRRDRWLV